MRNANRPLSSKSPSATAPVWLDRGVAAILFLTLSLGLLLPKLAGAGFLLMALVALVWLSLNRCWRLGELSPLERLVVLSVCLFVLVWLAGWLINGLHPAGNEAVGRILRLLLIIPLLLFVRRLDSLEQAWWHGLTMAGLLAGLYAWWFFLTGEIGEFEDRVGGTTNPIYFGGIALAMGLMLLPRLQDQGLSATTRLVAGAAILMAISASALSGSRGAWLVLPPLLVVYLFTLGSNQPVRWRFGIPVLLTAITLVVMFSPITPMGERAAAAISELTGVAQGQPQEGTIGRRLGLWQVAGEIIIANPLTGAGPGAFREALEQAVAQGRQGEHLLAYQHPHNQYLSALTQAGLPGLASLVLIFAMAFRRLGQVWSTGLAGGRSLGWAGLTAFSMLAVMALSESIFERNIGIIWFGLFTALSLGLLAARRRRELAEQAQRCHSLSVIVICKNEQDNIGRCLASVSGWADEIIVLDSGSTDSTVSICHEHTDRVEQTDWPGFGPQKQRALDLARGDWVLSLDADEALSDELKREIDHVLARPCPPYPAFFLPWRTRAFGQVLSFGHWERAPLRLFQRDRGRFTPALVHEKVVVADSTRVGFLEGRIDHYVFRDLAHARYKLQRYAELQAAERFKAGKRVRLPFSPHLRAVLNLIDNFLFRAAFLDGRGGWIMSRLYADYTFDKYQGLQRLQRNSNRS